MRGRLEPEEWSPLIASFLAYSKVRRSNIVFAFILAILLSGSLGLLLTRLYFSNVIPQTLSLAWLVGLIVLMTQVLAY